VHLGELADDLQVTASPAAALLSNGCAASPAAIPPTPDNTSACALDDNGSLQSFHQQSARASSDSGSGFNFAQQGTPAQYLCLVSFLKNGTMAASPLRAPTMVPACSPPQPLANQSAQSQYHCISSTEPERTPLATHPSHCIWASTSCTWLRRIPCRRQR
jgi:hypothetical protein